MVVTGCQTPIRRLRVTVNGAVQGVGFRPFVYRLATELRLGGWVRNSPQGVTLEVEGTVDALQRFLQRLTLDTPPQAAIHRVESVCLDACGETQFTIQPSDIDGVRSALVLPDLATCADCLREITDPHDRRYRYPFTNCTNCGPRFSIIDTLPYDRQNTTMRHFTMCRQCQAEYDHPHNRRFHAQPNACPQCGPHIEFWDRDGTSLASHHDALLSTAQALRQGKIVAMKGLGGFHLLVDGHNPAAVARLRRRKHRDAKPLALMYPSLDAVQADCRVSPLEARLLASPKAPIVLLRRRLPGSHPAVALDNPYLGIMLPYTPLHHVLMRELGAPVIATSGNRADAPMCIDNHEALARLLGIADGFLIHDRPIARHVDDSVARVILGSEQVLRRARGYAPLPIVCGHTLRQAVAKRATSTILAVGGHLKNTIALSVGSQVFMSQHIGDLETVEALATFQQTTQDLPRLYDAPPTLIACDAHPDYRSTRWAETFDLPLQRVQHHVAHVFACMAEHDLDGPLLGVAWDGTGYGPDGTIWGGEFFHVTASSCRRVGHFGQFRLPGGETAIKEPRRAALGLLFALYGEPLFSRRDVRPMQTFSVREQQIIRRMLTQPLNAPLTSSVGRLFDAVAAILGLYQWVSFEAQAAQGLEFAAQSVETQAIYPFRIEAQHDIRVIDWAPLVHAVLTEQQQGVGVEQIAATFHHTLAEIIVRMAQGVGEPHVVLTGGCFQNRYLTEQAVHRLQAEGFKPYWHQRVPPNDGGIALGQIVAALRAL